MAERGREANLLDASQC